MDDKRFRLYRLLQNTVHRFYHSDYQIWTDIRFLPLSWPWLLAPRVVIVYPVPHLELFWSAHTSYSFFGLSALARRCFRASWYALDASHGNLFKYSWLSMFSLASSGGKTITMSIGVLTSRPRNNLFGLNPVDSWGVPLYAARTNGNRSSQSRYDSDTALPSI